METRDADAQVQLCDWSNTHFVDGDAHGHDLDIGLVPDVDANVTALLHSPVDDLAGVDALVEQRGLVHRQYRRVVVRAIVCFVPIPDSPITHRIILNDSCARRNFRIYLC